MVLIMNYIIYHKYRNNKKRRNIFHIYNFSSSYILHTSFLFKTPIHLYVCMFFNVLLIVYIDRLLKWGWLTGWLVGSLADCQLFWLGLCINDMNILTILLFVSYFLLPPAPHLILTAAFVRGGRTDISSIQVQSQILYSYDYTSTIPKLFINKFWMFSFHNVSHGSYTFPFVCSELNLNWMYNKR